MFYDLVKIKVKAGDGGNGLTSFRHEKYKAKGGPDGGDGGHGGSIFFKVDPELNTLQFFSTYKNFKADNGGNGGKNDRSGKNAQDLILDVPQGTMVYDNKTNELLYDLTEEDEEIKIAEGGRSGFGNVHFKNSTNQAPQINQLGAPGEERELRLELKLVADVAIIGVPSVGKSTLISVISNARPKIADYPFTTIVPNLGVVSVEDFSFVIVDVPGLIKDAYKGKGLGDAFLRHIERSRLILHMVDASSNDPAEDYRVIRGELKKYKSDLTKKPEIVTLNKIDILGKDEELLGDLVKNLEETSKKKVFPISAAAKKNIEPLLFEIKKQLKKLPRIKLIKEKKKVFRPQEKLLENYTIEKSGDTFTVRGKKIERIASQTNPELAEGIAKLLRVFDRIDLIADLKTKGVKEGHIIKIGRRVGRFKNNMIIIVG